MSVTQIRCIVHYQNSSKTIFSSTFHQLKIQISVKFNLVNSNIRILDEDNSEIDSDAFEGYKSAGYQKLELTVLYSSESRNSSVINETIPEVQASQRPENSFSIEFIISSFDRQQSLKVQVPKDLYLNEVSDIIIKERKLDNLKFVCFFYSFDGQPLSPSFYTSQFLRVSDVLSDEERVFVIVSNNLYDNLLILKHRYERNLIISAVDVDTKESIELKINPTFDKEKELKDLIGLAIRSPSSSISIETQTPLKIHYKLFNNNPNLSLNHYNPVSTQSLEGLRLFHNFLYCLPDHTTIEVRKRLLAVTRYILPFNPFLYSFHLSLKQNFKTESELIALNEGSFFLFFNLNNTLRLNCPFEAFFEHTLDFFSFLFELADVKSFTKSENENFEIKIIANPFKVRKPVIVPLINNTFEIYDLSRIEELKKAQGSIPKLQGSIDNLRVDLELMKIIKRTEGVEVNELVIMKTCFDSTFDVGALFKHAPKILSFNDFEVIKAKRFVTQITSYLDLKLNSKRKTLTFNLDRKVVVNLGLMECSNDISIKNVLTGLVTSVDPDSLASVFNQEENISSKKLQVEEENYSRIPEEAISILLDTSGSMASTYQSTEKSRMTVAKDLFNSFINRSLGYNLPQIISLTTFDTSVKKVSKFTESAFKFCEYLEPVTSNGGTSIFDAIASATRDQKLIKKKYTNIKSRIICFSDGEDNSSVFSEKAVLEGLISNEIILDCINLGEKCIILKNLSLCSGGFAFWCENVEQGYKIFESDAFISVFFRYPSEVVETVSNSELASTTFKEFTSIPPPFKRPEQVKLKVSNIASSLMTMELAKPKFATSTGSLRFKRINREMALIHKNPHPDIQIYPCEADIQFWNGILTGPLGTPYEGGNFHFYISFPEEYPSKPPEIRFLTQIYHINVNSSGRICISVLNSDYAPEITILKLMQSIYGLFMNPEGSDSLDTNIASLFRSSRERYNFIAKEWTRSFAMKPVSELLQGISFHEAQPGVPVEFLCALTKKIMTDPVTCRTSGITYERQDIEEFIRKNGFDPVTRQPTSLKKLFPEANLLNNIRRFCALNIQ